MQMARSLTIMERSRMVAGGKIDALKKKSVKNIMQNQKINHFTGNGTSC